MTLLLSYSVGFNTTKSVGTSPSALTEEVVNLLEQSQGISIDNCECFKYSFVIPSNGIKTVNLSDLSIRFLKSVLLKSTQEVIYSYNSHDLTISFLFTDNKLPAILPSTISTDTIQITNPASTAAYITLALVGIV